MASVLDSVKRYQLILESSLNDEAKVLKCIDKLFNLGVTVQHLQDTGVGRTVNALRKESGEVGVAAKALINKWKTMVANEESSDPEDEVAHISSGNSRRDSDEESDGKHADQRTEQSHHESDDSNAKMYQNKVNGHHKRHHYSSEDEQYQRKRRKMADKLSDQEKYDSKATLKIKKEASESGTGNENSESEESDSSEMSSDDRATKSRQRAKTDHKRENENTSKPSMQDHSSRSKSSSDDNKTRKYDDFKKERKPEESQHTTESKQISKHYKELDKSFSNKHTIEKPKDGPNNLERHKSEKGRSSSSHSSERQSRLVEKHPDKHSSKTDKHRSSSEKHKSSSEKHKSSSEKHKSSTDKLRSTSESQTSNEKHKKSSEKESSSKVKSSEIHKTSSYKERHSSSSREKHGSDQSSHSPKNKDEKKRLLSSDTKVNLTSDNKDRSDKHRKSSDNKDPKQKSSSSSSHRSSSSSKTKEDVPKKKKVKIQVNGGDSDDGIGCESGASFAEALGMVSPSKHKRKPLIKDIASPLSTNEMSPAALLAPTAKLAPLPPLEISALPEISPHYKPRPPPKLLAHNTEDEALTAVIYNKNQRTKVYSGNKVYGALPSLYELCVNVLQEHIDALEYTGGVPYDILKPVVDRATPRQLFMLEHFNPYLMDDTDHLWQKHCELKFRDMRRQELESWREMYLRCQDEQEVRLKSLTANIKMSQEAKMAPTKQTKMAYVDTVVKPPRNIARKQAIHGTARAAVTSPAARVASLAGTGVVRAGLVRPPLSAPTTHSASSKPKKAPLMQRALMFMRGRKR